MREGTRGNRREHDEFIAGRFPRIFRPEHAIGGDRSVMTTITSACLSITKNCH